MCVFPNAIDLISDRLKRIFKNNETIGTSSKLNGDHNFYK